jgi:uncharacterized protein DUF1302
MRIYLPSEDWKKDYFKLIMKQQYVMFLKWLKIFSLGIFVSIVFLNPATGLANDISKSGNAAEIIPEILIVQNLAQNTDDDLDEFFEEDSEKEGSKEDDTGEISEDDAVNDSGKSNYFINGDISIKTGYRFNYNPAVDGVTDHSGLSHVTGKIHLEFGARFFESWDFFISRSAFYNLAYDIQDSDNYTDKFLDENESELELKKCYIRGSLTDDLDLKFGRQIVVWGKSDNIRITDVLNPLDLREPGMTDIEDLRLPVFMTRLDYYFSNISLSAYLIHEHRSHKLPVYGSSYYYLPFELPDDDEPSRKLKNTELALALAGTFSGFDISLYFADIYDDTPYLNANNKRLHKEILMTGFAANKAHGNFLYKAEAALFDGIRLSAYNQAGTLINNSHEYSRLDYLVGVEYSGFKNTTLSFEAADRWFMDFDSDAKKSGSEKHIVQYAIRGSKTFLNEVLEISVLASLYGSKADEGGFVRVNAAYDYTDAVVFELGVVFYDSGTSAMLKEIGENDTLFCSVTYSF